MCFVDAGDAVRVQEDVLKRGRTVKGKGFFSKRFGSPKPISYRIAYGCKLLKLLPNL